MARRFSQGELRTAKQQGMVLVSFAVAGDIRHAIEGPRHPTFAAKLADFVNYVMLRGDAALIPKIGKTREET